MTTINNLINRLSEILANASTDNIYGVLLSFADELDVISDELENMHSELFVDTATESYLEDLAEIFRIRRKSNETDNQLRLRIKAHFQIFKGSGTMQAIINAINTLTGISEDNITTYETEMKVYVNVNTGFQSDLEQTISDIVQRLKAAGIYILLAYSADAFEEEINVDDSDLTISVMTTAPFIASVSEASGTDVV